MESMNTRLEPRLCRARVLGAQVRRGTSRSLLFLRLAIANESFYQKREKTTSAVIIGVDEIKQEKPTRPHVNKFHHGKKKKGGWRKYK